MLGDIPQYELTVPYANTKVLVPYFEVQKLIPLQEINRCLLILHYLVQQQMDTAEDMDNYLFNLYTTDLQLQNNDEWYNNATLRFEQMLSMPTSSK
jgi:hypothetical protein